MTEVVRLDANNILLGLSLIKGALFALIAQDGCIRLENTVGAFSTDMLEDPETGAAVSIT